MSEMNCDVAIIGAGTAGLAAERAARKSGAKTLLLDDSFTGARPSVPKAFEGFGGLVLTNETVFELPTLPKSIAVIGAGPLGLELAQAFARLGADTEVFEQSNRVAGLRDSDVAKELKSVLRAEIRMHFGVKLDVAREGSLARISWCGAPSGTKLFESVLVAAGRPPDLHDLNLAAAGVAVDRRGVPKINETTLQCGDAPIFLAGDADGKRPVLHEAAFEGFIAGRNAAAYPEVRPRKRAVPLSIMFTDPPLAVIGAPVSDAMVVGTASFADQGRAKVDGCNIGLVRIYADRDSCKVMGAALFGPAMDHVAHLIAWSIERGETAAGILQMPFYHPTFEEGLKPALRQICEAVEVPELDLLDEVAPAGA